MTNKNYLERVENKLDEFLPNSGALADSMRYSVLDCGKRFRPTLTYTIADMFEERLEHADSSACAVELIHAYSLIHDDLPAMDDDDIRHSKPACHIRFGESQAILTGDALQALSFEIIANDNNIDPNIRIKCIQQLTHASFEMAQGQSIDMAIVSSSVDISVLESMHLKKTGALLTCAVKLGAIISKKCSPKDILILEEYSKLVGLAYQIQDDVLDLLVPDNVLGKRQNSDQKKNKPTYPSVLGLDKSQSTYKRFYENSIKSIEKLSVNANQLIELTNQLQSRRF